MDLNTTLVICAILAICTWKIVARAGVSQSLPEVLMERRLGSFWKQLDLENIVTGPKFSFPILGLLPLLGAEPWVTLSKWKKTYGPMFAIKMGIYDATVLNESKLIKEAYGRPEFIARAPFDVLTTACEGKGFSYHDGPGRAEQREFASKHMHGRSFRSLFEDSLRVELNQVLEDIEKECGRPEAIKGKFTVPVRNEFWNVFMGQRFENDDPELGRIYDHIQLVDFIKNTLRSQKLNCIYLLPS